MDNSKEYVKMCEKANEIQRMKTASHISKYDDLLQKESDYLFTSYDFVCLKNVVKNRFNKIVGVEEYPNPIITSVPDGISLQTMFGIEDEIFNNDNIIWLPRQDQLQEILLKDYPDYFNSIHLLLTKFYEEVHSNDKDKYLTYERFDSLEKLWLAYFMKVEYNKIWDDTNKDWDELQ